MGKSDTEKATEQQRSTLAQQRIAREQQMFQTYSTERQAAQRRADAERAFLTQQLQALGRPLEPAPAPAARAAAAGGGGGGGISAPAAPAAPAARMFGEPEEIFREAGKTGLIDPAAYARAQGFFTDLKGFDPERESYLSGLMRTMGGVEFDPTSIAQHRRFLGPIEGIAAGTDPDVGAARSALDRMRTAPQPFISGAQGAMQGIRDIGAGLQVDPGFQEFAETGGLDPNERAAFLFSAMGPVRGLAESNRRQLEQVSRIRGGDPSAALAASARETGRAGTEAAIGGQVALQDLIREGRQFGITGRAQQTQDIAQLRQLGEQAILSGNTELASLISGIERDIAAGRTSLADVRGQLAAAGAQEVRGMETSRQNLRLQALAQSGALGTEMQRIANEQARARAEGVAGLTTAEQETTQRGRLAGAEGLTATEQARRAIEEQRANRAAANARAAAARSAAGSRAAAARTSAERMFALQQLGYLYGAGPGETGQIDPFLAGVTRDPVAAFPQRDEGGGAWRTIGNIAKIAGPAIAAPFTGGASLAAYGAMAGR